MFIVGQNGETLLPMPDADKKNNVIDFANMFPVQVSATNLNLSSTRKF